MLINPATRASLGLATTDGPTFAHLHLTDLAAITTAAESWIGPTSTTGVYFKGGFVGIGLTTTPAGKFEVATEGATQIGAFSVYSNTASHEPLLYLRRGRGTLAVPATLQDGDIMGSVRWAGQFSATLGNYTTAAKIEGIARGAFTSGNSPTDIAFYTTPVSANIPLERVRILSSGNVGIGLTGPTAALHLKAGTATASTAPLKFTSGPVLSSVTSEAGAVEFLTDDLSLIITTGPARKGFVLNDGTNLTATRVPFATTNGRLTDSANMTYATNRLSPTYITLASGSATAGTAPFGFTSGALLGTPIAGAMEFYDGRFYLTGTHKQRVIDRTGDVVTASVDAVGTAETTLFTVTLSEGTARVGRIYKIHCDGVIKNNQVSDDVTFIFYRGATVLATVTPSGKTYAAGTGWHIDFNQTIRTVGAMGTLAQHGHIVIGGTDTAFQGLQTGIDFTVDRELTIKAKWSDNLDQTLNVVTLYQAYLELKN